MSDLNLLETEHLKIDEAAYQRLSRRAMDEVTRCLLVTESPSNLTMDKVRNRARIFTAYGTEPWARVTGVIQPKTSCQSIPSNVLQTEYYRLLRALRDQLLSTLLHKEREVWEVTLCRMVNEVEYAIFRVTESTVHLHHLTPTKKYKRYG